jgi:hypothetical protein
VQQQNAGIEDIVKKGRRRSLKKTKTNGMA